MPRAEAPGDGATRQSRGRMPGRQRRNGTRTMTLHVNGVRRELVADTGSSLVAVLRGQLGLAGTKVGCAAGQCGACSVFVDGVSRAGVHDQDIRPPRRRRSDHHRELSLVTPRNRSPDSLDPDDLAWNGKNGTWLVAEDWADPSTFDGQRMRRIHRLLRLRKDAEAGHQGGVHHA